MAPRSRRKSVAPKRRRISVAQQEDDSPMHQIITRSMKAKDFEELPDDVQRNESTKDQQRKDTLSVINHDGSVTVSLAVDAKRMLSACSKWSKLPNLGDGHKKLQIEAVSFEDDKAKDALRAVIDIVHRKNDGRHYTGGDPRFLFYSVLIHESLGAPRSIMYPEDEESDLIQSPYSPFFPPDSIQRAIFELAEKSKYLYRVEDWLLLAVVADKLKLKRTMQFVRDNLVLFCEADRRDMPDEVKHDSIKDCEWALIKGLRLIDDQMLETRLNYVERIFHGLRLLSHQVDYMDQGILPTREELDVYQEYRVAACEDCYSVSSDDFHQRLSTARLWPLGPSSYTMHQGSVINLIRTIRDMEEDFFDEAKRSMRSGDHGRACNQLTHFYHHLRNLRKELFCS